MLKTAAPDSRASIVGVWRSRLMSELTAHLEARYKSLVESSPIMTFISGNDGRLKYGNGLAREFFGEDLVGFDQLSAIDRFIHPDDRPEILEAIANAAGLPDFRVFRIKRHDDEWRWIIAHSSPMFAPNGEEVEWLTTAVDITESKDAMRKVDQTERQLRTLVDNLPDASVFLIDKDLVYRFAGGTLVQKSGFTPEDFVGKPMEVAASPEVIEAYGPLFKQALAGKPFTTEQVLYGLHIYTRGVPLLDDKGEVECVLALSYDVSSRAHSEEALRRSEERYRAFVANSSEGIYRLEFDPPIPTHLPVEEQIELVYTNGTFAEINLAMAKMYGFDQVDALLNKNIELMLPKDDSEVREYISSIIEAGYNVDCVQSQELDKDGNVVWFENSIRGVIQDGHLLRVWGTQRDITKQKQAEEDIRRSSQTFHGLVQNAPFGIYLVNSDFKLIQVSQGAQRVFDGIEPLIGAPFDEVLRKVWPEPFATTAIAEFRRTLETGITYHSPDTTERRRGMNATESYDWRIERMVLPDGTFGVVCYFYDMTEREKQANALKESEENFRLLVSQVKDYAIFRVDTNGRATSWNEGVRQVLGYEEPEFLGIDVAQATFLPEDVEAEIPRLELETAEREGQASNDRYMRRKDGSRFFANGVTAAIRDDQGNLIGFSKVMRDLTEKRRAEEALQTADRRKDEFLATLAHELRNPLSPIANAVELLKYGSDPRTLESVRSMMQRQVKHMVRLVDDLLDLSRITRDRLVMRKQTSDIASIIRSAVEATEPLLAECDQKLDFTVPDEPIYIDADPVRMSQVLVNLFSNACRYSDNPGVIHVEVVPKADMVEIVVTDMGIGIDPGKTDEIFEMFTQLDTAKGRTKAGMGIGLHLVKKIVELHGGAVRAASKGMGQGSTFTIELPRLASVAAYSTDEQGASRHGPSRSYKVLVVDDNVDAAESTANLLRLEGFETVAVHGAEEALEKVPQMRPDAILLDIGLPGMDGIEVCRRLRAQPQGENLLIIACTGWGQSNDRAATQEAGFDAHFVKPVDFQTLLDTLESRLEKVKAVTD
jgi:PAS domain S-box-containing protein